MKKKRRIIMKLLIGVGVVVAIAAVVFFFYVSDYYKAGKQSMESVKANTNVLVQDDGDILFMPVGGASKTGLILYPGAKVDEKAYAPLARKIAEKGYPVAIAKMRFHLAILSPDRAKDIIRDFTSVSTWCIGGHSLGGVMAANYALKDERIRGLVLLASYPQHPDEFKSSALRVLSLWGSNDKVANLTKVKAAKNSMPKAAKFIELNGGNHGGFGDYGQQKGDGQATITNEQQISMAAEYIADFLEMLK